MVSIFQCLQKVDASRLTKNGLKILFEQRLKSGTTALCQLTECQFYNIRPNANRPNAN
jgi:hypothetical protein